MLPPELVPKPIIPQQKKKKQNMYYLNSLIYDNYLRKNYQKSLSLIRNYESINQSKKTEFHLYMLGLIYRQLTQFDKSLNNFKQCYMMNKNNFEYLKQMTKGLYVSGKYKPAMEAAKDACLLNVDQEILCIMARIQLSFNNLTEASKYFENSIEIEPSDEAYMQLSEIYMKLGKKDRAYNNLKEGFKFSFENSEILDEMGKISIDIGKNNEAEVHFEKSLQINPKDVKALLALGSILQQKSQIDQAMNKYRTMHVVSPNSYELWNNVGLCMMNKNKNLAAYCCLRKAVFLDPLEWKPIANLGMICLKMKKYTLASVHFSTSLSLNPKNSQILNLLGVSLVYLNDFVNAQLAFQQGLNIQRISTKYSSSPSIYVNYFLMLLNKKDYQTARSILDEANKRMMKQIGVEKLDIMRNYLQSAS